MPISEAIYGKVKDILWFPPPMLMFWWAENVTPPPPAPTPRFQILIPPLNFVHELLLRVWIYILPLPLQEKDDLLSRFVKLSTQGDSRFDDRALRDIMINFILAGRDSTASVLSWLFYMLYRHPQVTAKVRDELSALETRCSNPGIYLLARTWYNITTVSSINKWRIGS